MELVNSLFSIVRNVSDSQREVKLIKQKMQFHIKKAEVTLQKFKQQGHKHTFVSDHLNSILEDAKLHFVDLENMLTSSNSAQESISLKDKIKLSLPFNNFKDRMQAVIQNLRQATEEMLSHQLSAEDQKKGGKKKSVAGKKSSSEDEEKPRKDAILKDKANVKHPQQAEVDDQIQNIYDLMGPTIQQNNILDFACQLSKKHTMHLSVQMLGIAAIANLFSADRKVLKVSQTFDRNAKNDNIVLINLGRMSFKSEYSQMKKVFPQIDKMSKLDHFKVIWKRKRQEQDVGQNQNTDQNAEKDASKEEFFKKADHPSSQKPSEGHDLFFSVPEQFSSIEIDNGKIIIDKSNKILYRMINEKWVKVDQETFEALNGEYISFTLNPKTQEPDFYFKITYDCQ